MNGWHQPFMRRFLANELELGERAACALANEEVETTLRLVRVWLDASKRKAAA